MVELEPGLEPKGGPVSAFKPAARRRPRSKADKRLVIALLIFVPIVLVVIFGPVFYGVSPSKGDLLNNLTKPTWFGKGDHPLGTDNLGRDVLARLMVGGRISLGVSTVALLIGCFVGVVLGTLAGYFGGVGGAIIMRLVDLELSIPVILLAMVLVVGLGPGLLTTAVALSVTSWVHYARLVRGQVLAFKGKDYLDSALAAGAGHLRILVRYVLPATASTIAVVSMYTFSSILLLESALTFLGFGVQPPRNSWGGDLGAGVELLSSAWWLSTLPGLLLMLTVLAVNLFGDWARDNFDPRGGTS